MKIDTNIFDKIHKLVLFDDILNKRKSYVLEIESDVFRWMTLLSKDNYFLLRIFLTVVCSRNFWVLKYLRIFSEFSVFDFKTLVSIRLTNFRKILHSILLKVNKYSKGYPMSSHVLRRFYLSPFSVIESCYVSISIHEINHNFIYEKPIFICIFIFSFNQRDF